LFVGLQAVTRIELAVELFPRNEIGGGEVVLEDCRKGVHYQPGLVNNDGHLEILRID